MAVIELEARRATREVFNLAEGPLWLARSHRVAWLDIDSGRVLGAPLTIDGLGAVSVLRHVPGTAGVAVLDADERLLVGVDGLILGPDGAPIAPRAFGADGGRRFNDGCVDPAGRLLVGTLGSTGTTGREELLRLEPDGRWTVLRSSLTLSNGVGFTADGRSLVHVDTLARTVSTCRYRDGTLDWHTAFTLDDGYPDGIAIDTENCVWTAVWGAGEVRRYTLRGTLLARVLVPARHVSSVAFVGDDLDRLVITTATKDRSQTELGDEPGSGALYLATSDVRGVTQAAWRPR